MKPTLGRIVLYVLSAQDAHEINRRRTNPENIANRISDKAWPIGAQAHIGEHVTEGDILPAQVVRVIECEEPALPVNLKVNLDGTDTFWARARFENNEQLPGTWHWMEYQKLQAAKEEPVTGFGSGSVGTALGVASDITSLVDPTTEESQDEPDKTPPGEEAKDKAEAEA